MVLIATDLCGGSPNSSFSKRRYHGVDSRCTERIAFGVLQFHGLQAGLIEADKLYSCALDRIALLGKSIARLASCRKLVAENAS